MTDESKGKIAEATNYMGGTYFCSEIHWDGHNTAPPSTCAVTTWLESLPGAGLDSTEKRTVIVPTQLILHAAEELLKRGIEDYD